MCQKTRIGYAWVYIFRFPVRFGPPSPARRPAAARESPVPFWKNLEASRDFLRDRLAFGFSTVTTHAKTLPIANIVTQIWSHTDWDHVVGVGLAPPGGQGPAVTTHPRVTSQHGKSPRFVSLVAVATLVSIRPILDAFRTSHSRRPIALDACWHRGGGLLRTV